MLKKILLLAVVGVMLSGCPQSTAILGPALTMAGTASYPQAGLTFITKKAMKISILDLGIKPDLLLVDGNQIEFSNYNQKSIIKGDEKFQNIAAASILAKTHRDELMNSLNKNFPNYNWNENKGYPTKKHRESIKKYGATIHHRKSFKLFDKQTKLNLFIPLITFN